MTTATTPGAPKVWSNMTWEEKRRAGTRIQVAEWIDKHGPIRVMAFSDGYAMVRRPGCMPFVRHFSDFGTSIHINDGAGRAALAAMEGKDG